MAFQLFHLSCLLIILSPRLINKLYSKSVFQKKKNGKGRLDGSVS